VIDILLLYINAQKYHGFVKLRVLLIFYT